jgi:hypothetical protein
MSVAVGGVAIAKGGDGAGACALPRGDDPVKLRGSDLSTNITNRYWPMQPGTVWTFRETDGDTVDEIVVTVTDRTKAISGGITARIVHDIVREEGRVVEDTDDYYAQDRKGNLWYLGERTREYGEGGEVSTAGSWEHGVDGAMAGIAIPARPEPGCSYRQEYYEGEAEDNGRILATDEIVQVPAGSFRGALSTQDTTPLEPWMSEHKLFAPGVGPVLTLQLAGGAARGELVSVERP